MLLTLPHLGDFTENTGCSLLSRRLLCCTHRHGCPLGLKHMRHAHGTLEDTWAQQGVLTCCSHAATHRQWSKGPELVRCPVSQGHALELAAMVLLLAAAGH